MRFMYVRNSMMIISVMVGISSLLPSFWEFFRKQGERRMSITAATLGGSKPVNIVGHSKPLDSGQCLIAAISFNSRECERLLSLYESARDVNILENNMKYQCDMTTFKVQVLKEQLELFWEVFP